MEKQRTWLQCSILMLCMTASAAATAQIDVTDINPDQSSLDAVDPDGATGGRVNGIGATPGNPDVLYAATEFGGIYRTSDFSTAGGEWFRLESHLPMLGVDVEVAPDGTAVYASSLYDGRVASISGINVSTDGGNSWIHPPTSVPPASSCADTDSQNQYSAMGIAVDPDDPAAVYIGTDCGLAISADYGASWSFSNPFAPASAGAIWDVVVHDSGIIDVCGQVGSARSNDGGASWNIGALPMGGRCSITASPYEADVLFATTGAWLYESDDGGASWTNLGTPDSRRQGRVPFVETNARDERRFDLWYGDVRLYRAGCSSNPAAGGLRCPPAAMVAASPPPPGWAGPFTRSVGGHDDVAALVFDPTGDGENDCPVLFASDGGVYFNTLNDESSCHNPQWEQPAVTPHALWLWAMDGFNPAGEDNLDLYTGTQDNGTFASINGGVASPAWTNRECCDGFDTSAASGTILYTFCCNVNPATRIYRRGQGMVGGGLIPLPAPSSYPPSGLLPGFRTPDSFDRYDSASYVAITRDCTVGTGGCVGADGGVFIAPSIAVDPIPWVELGNNSEPPSNSLCAVKSARGPGGQPVFYVQTGSCSGNNADQLWRFLGTNPAGVWQRVDSNLPSGGIGLFDVDPTNPNRLYASNVTASGASMVFSDDGGATWQADTNLDQMMTGNGLFRAVFQGTPALGAYLQPSLVAFDPQDPSIIVAGGVNSGVFVSGDGGASWLQVTDTETPVQSGRSHIPRPLYAYFDHDPVDRVDIYVGTRGKGVMRIGYRPPATAYQYAAKFICGDQRDADGLRLVRGRYATTINIHNASAAETVLQKRLSLAFPPAQQRPGAVHPIAWDWLRDDQSLKTDCDDVRTRIFEGSFPADYIEGYLTIRSTGPLDVTGVYTTADLRNGAPGGTLTHSSIDVEQITERDLRADLAIEKSADVFSIDVADNLAYHFVLYTVSVSNNSAQGAQNVTVEDSLLVQGENFVSVVGFLDTPVVLPPGGSVANVSSGATNAGIDLLLGDVAAGETIVAQFWAIAITYLTDLPASVDLQNTVVVSSQSGDPSPANNTDVLITPVVP